MDKFVNRSLPSGGKCAPEILDLQFPETTHVYSSGPVDSPLLRAGTFVVVVVIAVAILVFHPCSNTLLVPPTRNHNPACTRPSPGPHSGVPDEGGTRFG